MTFLTGSVLEELPQQWDIIFLLSDGTEYALDLWTSVSLNVTFDGVTADLDINGLEPVMAWVRELVTDVVFARNAIPLFRMRVVDAEDTFTRDAWTVKLSLVSYEHLLGRRILLDEWVLVDYDIDAAWKLIQYTQGRETLHITRGTQDRGVMRQRSLSRGDTIRDSITNFAEADAGFDWWIDQNLVWWVQKPRRGKTVDAEWGWGDEIAEVTRTSPMEDYASLVMAVGAQGETKIPNPPGPDRVYPPPVPQLAEAAGRPFGLWETSVSYSDVITENSLLEKARWHLGQKANIRPTYKIVLEPGVWQPNQQIGDVFTLRIQAPPRMDIRVPARVEEIEIALTGDGGETVSMSVRAEEPETFVTASPLGAYPIVPGSPLPTGRSVARHRLHPWDDLGAVFASVDARLGRQERQPGV